MAISITIAPRPLPAGENRVALPAQELKRLHLQNRGADQDCDCRYCA